MEKKKKVPPVGGKNKNDPPKMKLKNGGPETFKTPLAGKKPPQQKKSKKEPQFGKPFWKKKKK